MARRLPNIDGVLIAGHDGTAQQIVNVDSSGNLQTGASDATASGTITAINQNVAVSTAGKGTVTIQITGTYTASGGLTPQVTTDGTNWITQASNTTLVNMNTGASSATISDGSTGIWQIEVNGHAQFRIIALGAVTGTATITLRAGAGTSQVIASVTGNVASGATDSGNPVKVAGVYNSTKPTLTNGQRGDLQLGTRGGLHVNISGADNAQGSSVGNGAVTDPAAEAAGLYTYAQNVSYNGTQWNKTRGNTDITVLASAARTATASSADQTNYNGRGAHIVIDCTAITATPSVVFTVEGKDALSGAYYTLLTSAAIVATGTTRLTVYPGATVAANVAASEILPRTWRVTATHGDADSITFSVGASIIL